MRKLILRNLLLLVLLLVPFTSMAGSLKEVDLVTRETVVEFYSQGWNENVIQPPTENDIWNLEITAGTSTCLVVVKGYVKLPSQSGVRTDRFWVCINKSSHGGFDGELIDHEQVADE